VLKRTVLKCVLEAALIGPSVAATIPTCRLKRRIQTGGAFAVEVTCSSGVQWRPMSSVRNTVVEANSHFEPIPWVQLPFGRYEPEVLSAIHPYAALRKALPLTIVPEPGCTYDGRWPAH
jgi:hypothetical protein